MIPLKNFDFVFTTAGGDFATFNMDVSITNDGKLELVIAAEGDLNDDEILNIAKDAAAQRLRMALAENFKILFTPEGGDQREISNA